MPEKLKEITVKYVSYMPEIIEPDILYISKEFGLAVHLCPLEPHFEYVKGDGWTGLDGDYFDAGRLKKRVIQNILPLKPRWKDGWELTENQDGTVTLSPSILNRVCKHHYFIKNSQCVPTDI